MSSLRESYQLIADLTNSGTSFLDAMEIAGFEGADPACVRRDMEAVLNPKPKKREPSRSRSRSRSRSGSPRKHTNCAKVLERSTITLIERVNKPEATT